MSCSFVIEPASACAGSSVTMTLNDGWCDPECKSINFKPVKSHPFLTVTSLGGLIDCEDSLFTREFNINVSSDAPPGVHSFALEGIMSNGAICSAIGEVTLPEYDTVEILYKTFIACEVAGPTPPAFWLFDFFRGDNRGFGYAFGAADSRTLQRLTVTVDPSIETRIIGAATQVMGITQGFDDHPDGSDVTPLPTPTCGGQCAYGFVPGATPECTGTTPDPVGQGMLAIAVTSINQSNIQVVVTNRAKDQCEDAVPGIDVDLILLFRQTCEDGILGPMEFKASGSYDGYPWHELYLNGNIVFVHDPCVTGEGPSSMFGNGEHNFDGTGQFPEVDPSQTGTNLSIWQPVP